MELGLQQIKNVKGSPIAESTRSREQALLTDESFSPVFRDFIQTWARKIERAGGGTGCPAVMDALEMFVVAHRDVNTP